MITRRVLSGRMLGVEYALTPLGRSLHGPLSQVYDWTVANMDVIQSRQHAYDEELRGESVA
ncbi:hypothetical protein GCM10010151_40410 [Actinoallomurus spadix]|uniref:HTH hxlR-type domain-containing protein n=2 Tax=Actinoallomurus spadix TaxID=79912 RepID=A0ABP3GJ15_9ACTN